MDIWAILKIAIYIGIIIGTAILFERFAYMGSFYRYVAPFFFAILFGLGLYFIMGEEWYFCIGGAALMLIIGSCSDFSLFGAKNGVFRIVTIVVTAIILLSKLVLLDPIVMNLVEKNDPRIAEINESIDCQRGVFHLESYQFHSKGETQFSITDYPRPYYFSYTDVSGNSDNSTNTGLDSIQIPCLPTKENLGEIKTLIYAVKHKTTGALYDRYVNGVKAGQKTLYNSDVSFLIINLDTKECYVIHDALYGQDAQYAENQKKIKTATAEKYINDFYRRHEQ